LRPNSVQFAARTEEEVSVMIYDEMHRMAPRIHHPFTGNQNARTP